MPDAVDELVDLLKSCNARVTLDPDRNFTHPCFRCGTQERPRHLVDVGVWTMDVYGGMKAGDPITRPMCDECITPTPQTQKADPDGDQG